MVVDRQTLKRWERNAAAVGYVVAGFQLLGIIGLGVTPLWLVYAIFVVNGYVAFKK